MKKEKSQTPALQGDNSVPEGRLHQGVEVRGPVYHFPLSLLMHPRLCYFCLSFSLGGIYEAFQGLIVRTLFFRFIQKNIDQQVHKQSIIYLHIQSL